MWFITSCFLLAIIIQYVSCSENILELEVKNENTVSRIVPNKKVTFESGMTICLRAKFTFWDSKVLFDADQISVGIFDFPDLEIEVLLMESSHLFKWPTKTITSFNSWYSFCIVVNAHASTMTFTVQGIELNTTNSILKNMTFSKEVVPEIRVGYFDGQITDLNMWNLPLSTNEVGIYSTGWCNRELSNLSHATSIFWDNANISTDINQMHNISRFETCSNRKGMPTLILINECNIFFKSFMIS